MVLAAEDRIPAIATRPVWVLGTGQHGSHTSMSEWRDFTTGPASVAGPMAFGQAGVTPEDMDLACIYDAFSFMLAVTVEDLGFCKKGEVGPFLEHGRMRLGGELPINPDGGGLSACHPGMRGLFLLVEATKQLRHDYADAGAPERQVTDAEFACGSGTGGWVCSNGTLILARG